MKSATPNRYLDEKSHQERLSAETQWFHVFPAMINNGDVAKMGPHAAIVYVVIKAHAHYDHGRAFPALETIAEKSGVSLAQVKRAIKVLEELSYITKTKSGRHNVYRLREKINLLGKDGQPTAIATWDYLPSTVKYAVAELNGQLEGRSSPRITACHEQGLQPLKLPRM